MHQFGDGEGGIEKRLHTDPATLVLADWALLANTHLCAFLSHGVFETSVPDYQGF